jgi:hypothetical protein
MDLGMGSARTDMMALTYTLTIGNDDTTDPGIGVCGIKASSSQLQGACHETMVNV